MSSKAVAKVDAVLLAGAPNDGALREYSDAPLEALIEVGGRPMVAHVLDALHQSGRVGTVAIVGPPEPLEALLQAEGDAVSQSLRFPGDAGSLPANLELGFEALDTGRPVLVITSDLPFITAEAVAHFLDTCSGFEADIYYPVIPREDSEARFPGVKRTYARLVEGEFTGGNLALLSPKLVREHGRVMRQAMALRKNPFALARLFGIGLFLKLAFRRLRIADVEKRFEKAFGVRARAVLCRYPEVGMDVDKPEDLAFARKAWAGSTP